MCPVTLGVITRTMEPEGDLVGVTRVTALDAPPVRPDGELAAFYAASWPRIVSALTLAAGSRADAEECVQEAFVRLVPRWATVRTFDDPEAWVRKVAFRLSASRWRRMKAGAAAVVRSGPARSVEPPGLASVVVAEALAGMPLAQRQVLVLHHVLGLPLQQIADEIEVPVGTVKSRLSRARAAAAATLGSLDD